MSQGVHVLGGKCPGGKCPGGKCPEGTCPWGKCPGGTCPGGLCPRTVYDSVATIQIISIFHLIPNNMSPIPVLTMRSIVYLYSSCTSPLFFAVYVVTSR